MRTDTLSNMVRNLRSEAGHALSVAQGTNQYDTLKYLLARTQEELWVAFVWPELVIRVMVPMVAGQYLYTWPVGSSFDMVRSTWFATAGSSDWDELDYGISEDQIAPDGSNTNRSDPVQVWDVASPTQFRVWPTPNTANGMVRFKCQRQLTPFIADSDQSTLDATVIVLFAASEMLARSKAEDAANKLQKAQRHLTKLLGNQISAKHKIATLGGGSPDLRLRTDYNLLVGPR